MKSISVFFNITKITDTAQKMKFSIKDLFKKCDQILSRKLNFLCSVISGEKMLMSGELKGSGLCHMIYMFFESSLGKHHHCRMCDRF